ncbi:MAG: hypothetical protein EPN76_08670 [Burkholderiaceae bacterium]|nr:MAG: hypothetical protein EPN76_08670 [Burkholderiaceae bacterium]
MHTTTRTFSSLATLLLLLVAFVVASPARGSNQFNVHISIVSQCGPQPGPLFGPSGQVNIACLSPSTVFHAQQFSMAPGSTVSADSGTRANENASGGQPAHTTSTAGGIDVVAPSVNFLSPPLPPGSAKNITSVVYVVF